MNSSNPFVIIAKYAVVGVIWIGVLVFGIALAQTQQIDSGNNVAILGIAAFIAAAIATGVIITTPHEPLDEAKTQQAAADAKQKNAQRGIDPMSLLSDDDIAELREEIKMDVRRRLLQSEEGELNSLDALLADQKQSKRR